MTQQTFDDVAQNLKKEYGVPQDSEDVTDSGVVANPTVFAECTNCHSILKNMKATVASGRDGDREGHWVFSCRTPWCGSAVAGKGSVSVDMKGGEIVSKTPNASARLISANVIYQDDEGIPFANPDMFYSIKEDEMEQTDE